MRGEGFRAQRVYDLGLMVCRGLGLRGLGLGVKEVGVQGLGLRA